MTYRGLLHVHSTYSYDGKLSLVELKHRLQAAGLAFAAMTEHTDQLTTEVAQRFVAECRALSDSTFVFLPGFEVPYGRAHLLHLGATDFKVPVARNEDELLLWRAAAPLVILAHPVRNRWRLDATLRGLIDGVEVWNQQYDGKRVPRPRSLSLLRSLRRQSTLLGTVGVDFHRPEHLGAPYTTVTCKNLSEAHLLDALIEGSYQFDTPQGPVGGFSVYIPSRRDVFISVLSIVVIRSGKLVNAGLARVGIRLPKGLIRRIRARV